jgi:hypothetical protein
MSIEIQWTGTDGSEWDLRRGPVRTTSAGIKGLSMPDVQDQVKTTALRDGQRLSGWRLKPREVWLPLRFKDDAERDVEGLQRQFWRSMAIGDLGTLTVTDGAGSARSIGLRFQDDGGLSYKIDPYILTDAIGVSMIADQPWWEGPAQTFDYSLGDVVPVDFFGAGAGAPDFYIMARSGSSAQSITNLGDQPAWPTVTLVGDFLSFRLGVGGHYVGGPIVVGGSDTLLVETDPLRQLVFLNADKVTRQLTEIDFAPIPKGASVPLSLDVTGTGRVTVSIKPRYARAL